MKHNLAMTIKTAHVYAFDAAISFLRTCRETPAIVENGPLYKLIDLVALFVRAKDGKESKCSSIKDPFNEWKIYTMEYSTATKNETSLCVLPRNNIQNLCEMKKKKKRGSTE